MTSSVGTVTTSDRKSFATCFWASCNFLVGVYLHDGPFSWHRDVLVMLGLAFALLTLSSKIGAIVIASIDDDFDKISNEQLNLLISYLSAPICTSRTP